MAAPPFVPLDASLSRFGGFLRVGKDEFKVQLHGVDSTGHRISFANAELHAEAPLAQLLAPHREALKVRRTHATCMEMGYRLTFLFDCMQIRLKQSSSLVGFLRELQELVAISVPVNSLPQALPSAEYYTLLMHELDTIGWHHVLELSEGLRTLELQAKDAADRAHAIRITLPREYAAPSCSSPPICAVDAPEQFELAWDSAVAAQKSALALVLEQFQTFLETFQGFWAALDEIDAECCVLEPQHPTRATGRRRVALAKHASLQIEINAAHPRAICELRFFGNDATVVPLRERWSEGVLQWDELNRSPRENLEAILGVQFPSPRTTDTEEFAIECGICYCYRLDAEVQEEATTKPTTTTMVPDRLCENSNCNRPFHEKCLFEWLKALPTARQSFNTVFGECPYCREAISAKFLA